jgi:hypothetical protein
MSTLMSNSLHVNGIAIVVALLLFMPGTAGAQVGPPVFAAAVSYGAGNGPVSVAIGDIDRDGKPTSRSPTTVPLRSRSFAGMAMARLRRP